MHVPSCCSCALRHTAEAMLECKAVREWICWAFIVPAVTQSSQIGYKRHGEDCVWLSAGTRHGTGSQLLKFEISCDTSLRGPGVWEGESNRMCVIGTISIYTWQYLLGGQSICPFAQSAAELILNNYNYEQGRWGLFRDQSPAYLMVCHWSNQATKSTDIHK